MIYGVILAGGRGERFWPLSSYEHPKQLLKLTSDKTMLEETVDRFSGFVQGDNIMIVTGEHLKKGILKSVATLTENNLLLEPQGKNTCVAVGLAAVHIAKETPDGVMVILSSDHLIAPRERLLAILKAGAEIAYRGKHLITIGVVPTRPETAYGYIELGEEHKQFEGVNFYRVGQFKEKPQRTEAQKYVIDRHYLWNSGMFIWRADTILEALKKYSPSIYECLDEYSKSIGTENETAARIKLYEDCDNISIDFAIMEKAENVLTIKGDIKWDDVGSWLAMGRFRPHDRENNVAIGDVLLEESFENIVVNDDDGIIVGYGVSDLVIVKTGDVVMVAHKTRVGEIKKLISIISKEKDYEKYL